MVEPPFELGADQLISIFGYVPYADAMVETVPGIVDA
jgi:hypothetical protein